MSIGKILKALISKANLDKKEAQEVEKAFFELLGFSLLERLGNDFVLDQKEAFVRGLEELQEEKSSAKIVEALRVAGFDSKKADDYLQVAAKQAFTKLIEVLSEWLSADSKEEILREVE